jgi:hypothetical protein
VGMTEHALDAITLVPRERVCDHNRDPAYADRKIVDVDVYVAGQQRGTWRHSRGTSRYNRDNDSYGLYLELLDGSGAMTFAENMCVGSVAFETLKATTADLLVARKLPTRRMYFERRVMVLLIDNKLKIAAVLAVGLGYWLLR